MEERFVPNMLVMHATSKSVLNTLLSPTMISPTSGAGHSSMHGGNTTSRHSFTTVLSSVTTSATNPHETPTSDASTSCVSHSEEEWREEERKGTASPGEGEGDDGNERRVCDVEGEPSSGEHRNEKGRTPPPAPLSVSIAVSGTTPESHEAPPRRSAEGGDVGGNGGGAVRSCSAATHAAPLPFRSVSSRSTPAARTPAPPRGGIRLEGEGGLADAPVPSPPPPPLSLFPSCAGAARRETTTESGRAAPASSFSDRKSAEHLMKKATSGMDAVHPSSIQPPCTASLTSSTGSQMEHGPTWNAIGPSPCPTSFCSAPTTSWGGLGAAVAGTATSPASSAHALLTSRRASLPLRHRPRPAALPAAEASFCSSPLPPSPLPAPQRSQKRVSPTAYVGGGGGTYGRGGMSRPALYDRVLLEKHLTNQAAVPLVVMRRHHAHYLPSFTSASPFHSSPVPHTSFHAPSFPLPGWEVESRFSS